MSLVSELQKLAGFQEEIQPDDLRRLHQMPLVILRTLARDWSTRLGTINFFQAVVEKGLVNMHSLSPSNIMLRHDYLHMLARVIEKSKLPAEFLTRRVAAHEALQVDIEALKAEMNSMKVNPQ